MKNLLGMLKRRAPGSASQEAWRLAAEGRYVDAVRVAERADVSDGELAKALVGWRNRAIERNATGQGRVGWPPQLPDPFPGVLDEIPEASLSELTPEMLGGALLHHGSLIVRGMLEPVLVEELRRMIDRSFAVREAHLDQGGPQTEWYAHAPIDDPELEVNRPWLGRTAMVAADSPVSLAHWIGMLRSIGVFDLITRHFGETPVLSAKKTTFYRVLPGAGSQWHQDGAFLGADIRVVNMWTALSDCGREAPGLDIVPWRLPGIVQPGTHGAKFHWSVGEAKVDELAAERGRPVATPEFRPGDSIFFDQMCLHRTGVRPEMTKTRYAVECWMFAPSHYADKSNLLI